MSDTLVIRTPAKINLSLDITGKLPNGYHTMRSVFQTVGIYDTLTLRKNAPELPLTLTCNASDVPCDEHNLIWKAAMKLLGAQPQGLAIHLEKNIPAQAGMGGGSSDCAAALVGIRKLFALPVSDSELHTIAASLGADCAFFLFGGTCYAGGIGDQITPLPDMPRKPLVIAKGTEGISTPEAYRRLDAYQASLPHHTDNVLNALEKDVDTLFSVCGNHFDAITDLAEVEAIRTIMRTHGLNPVLSGSGSAVFAGCSDFECAERCAQQLRAAGLPFVAVTETVPAASEFGNT